MVLFITFQKDGFFYCVSLRNKWEECTQIPHGFKPMEQIFGWLQGLTGQTIGACTLWTKPQ